MPQCFSPAYAFIYVYKRSCRTKRVRSRSHPIGRLLNLGALKEAFATKFGASFLFDLSGRVTQGQPTIFSAQLCRHSGFAPLRGHSHEKDLDRLCFSCRRFRQLHLGKQAMWTATGCDTATAIEILRHHREPFA